MAKLFSAKGFSKQFGESFLTSLENERKRIQEQKLFNQKLGFQNRQLDLLDKYRQGTLENYAKQEKRLNEQGIANLLGTGLYTLGEVGRVNQRTGEKDTSPNFNLFGETFTYLPETPKQLTPKEKLLKTVYEKGQRVDYYGTSPENRTKAVVHNLPNSILNPKNKNGKTFDPELSGLFGKAETLLNFAKITEKRGENIASGYKDYTEDSDAYKQWKAESQGVVSSILNKAGLNLNSPILNKLRKVLPSDDEIKKQAEENKVGFGELKRIYLNEAMFDPEFTKKYPLTQEQSEAIRYWIELGTR